MTEQDDLYTAGFILGLAQKANVPLPKVKKMYDKMEGLHRDGMQDPALFIEDTMEGGIVGTSSAEEFQGLMEVYRLIRLSFSVQQVAYNLISNALAATCGDNAAAYKIVKKLNTDMFDKVNELAESLLQEKE